MLVRGLESERQGNWRLNSQRAAEATQEAPRSQIPELEERLV